MSSEEISEESDKSEDSMEAVERKKDLLMSHLIRVACFYSQELLSKSLPQITMELHQSGLISEGVVELSSKSIEDFNYTFDRNFNESILQTLVPDFWKLASLRTRYLQNFKELKSLGKGGFGRVVLCQNKHDGREYALKLIESKTSIDTLNYAMLREVEALSGLQHHHVVRYYQAWIEQGVKHSGETLTESEAEDSLSDTGGLEDTKEQMTEYLCLYIQMEYCPRTLRHHLDVEGYNVDKDFARKTIHQILDGLGYIHEQNIIHRDLTPSNIFFDSSGDVKIGDFGLAKFLDKDEAGIIRTTSKSRVESQELGTKLYLAPEIVKGAKDIGQKVDIYSLGIVFLEIWHPFETGMERSIVLGDLKDKGKWPEAWVLKYPVLATQVKLMLSEDPNERPTITELRSALSIL